MIVWGGIDSISYFNSGGRYSPATNSWAATEGSGAPAARMGHAAVWTGSDMIIWGGTNGSVGFPDTLSYTPGRVFFLYQRP